MSLYISLAFTQSLYLPRCYSLSPDPSFLPLLTTTYPNLRHVQGLQAACMEEGVFPSVVALIRKVEQHLKIPTGILTVIKCGCELNDT